MKRLFEITFTQGDSVSCRSLDIILFRRFWFWFIIGVDTSVKQIRILPNTDIQLLSEPLPAADHWSMQPRRPDGTPW